MVTYEEKQGKTLIRVVANADGGFDGTTINGGKRGAIFHDEDRSQLLAHLRNEAGKHEPGYFGMDAAIARFLKFMPGGFSGERIHKERGYKCKASAAISVFVTTTPVGYFR